MRDRAAGLAVSTSDAGAAATRDPRESHGDDVIRRLPRRVGVHAFRASFAQERVWVLEQIAAGRGVANIAGTVRAEGRLDLARLARSLDVVAARHESLRTTFVVLDGTLTQVVSPHAVVSFAVREVPGCGMEEREGAATRAIAVEAEAPFDVSRGPLVRVRVFPVTATRHLVAVVVHHLVADAWSMAVLVREIAAAYRADRGDGVRASAGPRTLLHAADVAAWQREALRSERYAAARAYWSRQLADVPAAPELGRDDRCGGRMTIATRPLSPGTVAGVRALARENGTTLFTVGLAAWHLVLGQWLARHDVVVLSPVADRDRPEVADVVGFLVNVVALRLRWEDDRSFRALLGHARECVREALCHQGVPFEEVLTGLGIARAGTRAPLTPFGFALDRFDAGAIALPDLELVPVPMARATTRTLLSLVVVEGPSAILLRVEHDPDGVDPTTARALLESAARVLERVAVDPDLPLSVLEREMDSAPVSRLGSSGRAASREMETVWEGFAAHAERTPAAVALRIGDEAVGYGALRGDAERVARALRAAGIAPGALVAVWGARGRHLAASLLGVFHAGAVYVPVDPRWPAARVAEVLRRSGARIVLAPSPIPAGLAAARALGDAWRIVASDAPANDSGIADAARPAPADPAYVLYTSGTTGRPKGAVIPHAALLNHLRSKIELLELGPGDRVAQTAAAGFDISLWQYLAAWLVGGEVVVLGDAVVRDPERLVAETARRAVTVLELVPAVMELLLDATPPGAAPLPTLRWILATGEALPPALCRAWLARHPAIPIVNAYGPTECADDVAHHVVRTPPAADVVRMPIGFPIAGVTLHVLDDELRPVAVGEVGELCVSGVAVGLGYLHDPERTAPAFVTWDSTRVPPGESTRVYPDESTRLYRTGDAGRRLPDGTFECLGRRDRQVKIRGVRVEPEEIEGLLRDHPTVRQVAVVSRPGPDGAVRLVACIVVHGTSPHVAEDLRRWLGDRVPEAMIPAAFELHAALPLTANGKIDHAALGAARSEPTVAEGPPAVPTSGVTRTLAEIWCEVLGLPSCALHDDFFALGGDSLASIRVVASARRHAIQLTPLQMFEHRTIARLAAVATVLAVDPAEQGPVVGAVVPTPVQRMFLEAALEGKAHYNLSTLLEVSERLRPAWLGLAVEHLMRHHDVLRARWRPDAGGWRQTIAGLDGPVPFTSVDLSTMSDADASATVERTADEAQASLCLEDGPLVRVVLFDLGPVRPSRLLVVVHHLACDVASWPILLEDLAALYEQLRRGEPVALPAKTTSVQTWACRLRGLGTTADATLDVAFWQAECRAPVVDVVSDGSTDAPAVGDVAFVRTELGPRETADMLGAAAALGVTVESLLLTSLALAITERRGGDAVLVYLERHGRTAIVPGCDVSRTVGWFTAVFPLRIAVAPGREPVESLAVVDAHLRAVPQGGVGYGVLRYSDGAAAAELAALPRPRISVNYLGRVDPPERSGWRLARESAGREVGVTGTRPTLLDVTACVSSGRFSVEWAYDRVRCTRAGMETLADRTCAILRDVVERAPDVRCSAEER